MSEQTAKRTKIAYVINDLKLGGAQKMLLELTSKLDRAKFEIIVYYLNPKREEGGYVGSAFLSRGITIVCVSPDGKKGLLRSAKRLALLWRDFGPDIVHAHLPYCVIASGFALFLRRGTHFV